jgi:menaquinol-cytochrome c reductase iron-sulfur subunit
MNRRAVSGLFVAGGTALFAGAIGIPVLIGGIAPALRARSTNWRLIGELEAFPIGRVTVAEIKTANDEWPHLIGEQSVFVWRATESAIVVYSRSCTDLGCPLEYHAGCGCFICPCHGGIFSQEGSRLAGPPKSPMHRFEHRIRSDLLEIDLSSIPPAA